MVEDSRKQLRCYCRRRPLLAVVGSDEKTHEPYLHIKSWKQDRIFVEVVALSGDIKIRCRECLRWFTVRIRKDVDVKEETLPESIDLD